MLAMDGPMVMSLAPAGTFALIHSPASRPPGTPPDPARNWSEPEAWTRDQLGTTSVRTSTPTRAALSQRPVGTRRRRSRPLKTTSWAGAQRANVLAARIARAGAIGNKY